MSNDQTVRGFYPGYRARKVAKIGLVSSLIFFMVLASIGAWLPGLVSAIGSIFPVPQGSQESCSPLLANTTTAVDPLHQICATANGTSGEVVPQGVDASRLPDLHMPKEVVSGVANAGLTGVVRTASDNLTLYGHDLMLRMIGGLNPHDELVGGTGRGVKPALTWVVDAWNGQSWVSIPVASTSFTVLDPNSNAGTSVVRSIGFGKPTLIALLNVTYIVSQTGGLSWSLDLKPLVSSEYRIDLSISETTQVPSTPANTITLPANDTSIAPRENSTSPSPTSAKLWIGPAEYALSWSDVPSSFKTTTSQNGRHFNLSIDLGSVVAGGSIVVDPTLVGSDNDNLGATTYPFQHHIYQDPKTGYYWIFYHDPGIPNGNGIVYRYSPDGSNWYPSPYYTIPSAWWCGWCYGPDDSVASPAIYFIGETVIMAGGASYASGGLLDGSPQYLYMTLMTGTLSGTQIIWHPGGTGSGPFFESGQCWNAYDQNNPFNCYMSVGIRYLSVATDSAGRIWLTLDGYYYSSPCSPGNCGQAGPGNSCFDYYTGTNRGFYDESYLYLVEIDTAGVVHSVGAAGNNNGSKGGCYRYDLYEHQRSVALPADTQGGTRIIFQGELYTYTPDLSTVTGTQIQLYAQWYNGVNPVGLMDTIEPNVADTNDFSAVSGIEDGTHVGTDVVYRGTDGNITYAYRSPFSPIWTYEKNIFSGVTVTTPVVTTDYSTGDVYVFGTTSPMKIDGSAVAGCSHSTTQCQVTLTTSSTNELIIVYTTEALDLQPSCTFYVRDSAGLTYSSRSGPSDFQNNVVYGNGGRDQLAEFYAKSVNQLSSDTITESISGCQSSFGGEYNGLMAFAISGANFNTPFDPHSALAGAANGQGGLISALISTNYPNDMIISGLQDGGAGCPVPTPGTGFIAITSSGCAATEYQIIGVPVTNYPIGFSDSVNGAWEQIADAVEPASGPSIVMRTRTLADHFADHSILYPVTLRSNAAILETSFAVASLTNSSSLPLIWSEPTGPSSYNVIFASIPVQTVWSPYGLSRDPWDSNGLVPYGQYFQSFGEYVSTSTGILTIKQTDLSLPGRGLSFDFTRVYTEPYSFLNGQPYNYEAYPWAPMGDGWQLNFPWMTSSPHPLYLHLSDGQGYRLPFGFWNGATATFENHQGENFRLVRFVNGTISLYDKSGTSYNFGTNPNHSLTSITDSTGNNTITLNYSNNLISCISDAIQRPFTFSYSGQLLQKISQVNGGCANPGSTIRSVSYGYVGQSLASVTDPAGRVTFYSTGSNPWLISQITYPTGWYDSYSYIPYRLGTQATTYRVSLQQVMSSPASPVRQFAYTFSQGPGDQIIGSVIESYNGTQPAGFMKYAFSFLGDVKNVTDTSGIVLSGNQQIFGVGGEIPKDVTILSDGQGHLGSYTTYNNYDLWGNQIYSRRVINPSSNWYHESFNSYYNNAEPPGFYAFQDSFSRNRGTASDNSWNVTNGYWMVNNGVYNGTPTTGPQEGVVAYSSLNKTDISIQARILLSRLVNTTQDQRFGIFAHYAGGPLFHKWAIVIRTLNGAPDLELLDEWNQWLGHEGGQPSAMSSCSSWTIPLISTSVWYTFNMTVHGAKAAGWVSAPGQPQCLITGVFQSTSPAINGQGFGLYASTYSALFDDVQVATVSPYITSTGFSNSFIQSGGPGPIGFNTWLATTKPPGPGWNTTVNWLAASAWSQAYPSQNYGASPWGTLTGWPDNSAQWLWATTNANVSASLDPVWFRRTFAVSAISTLNVAIATDDTYVVYLDGSKIGTGSNWQQVGSYTSTVNPGYHILSISATNIGGPAGLLVSVKNTGTGQVIFRSDATAGPNIVAIAGTAQLTGASPPSFVAGWNSARQNAGSGTTTQTVTICNLAGGCKAGDTIIVNYWQCCSTGQSLSSVTDSQGNSYTEIALANGANSNSVMADVWGTLSVKTDTASLSVTVTYPDTTHYRAIFVQQYRNVLGIGATHFTGQSSCTSTSETLTTTRPNSLVSISFDIGFMTAMSQTGGPSASNDFSYTNAAGWGLFLWDSTIPSVASNTWTWNVSGCSSSYQSEAIELLAAQPVETYFGYAPWSGLTQTKQLFTPASVPQWLTTSRTYDIYGNLVNVVDPRGNSTSYGYLTKYSSAYLTSQTQTINHGSNTIVSSFGYNSTTGSMIWAQQPNGYLSNTYNTTYNYDILGRHTKTTYPTGDFTSYTFNDAGNYVNITNENGLKTKQVYDGLGRLSSTQRFLNGAVYSSSTYTYNWMDKTTSSTDTLGNTYAYKYDALGRLNMTVKPDGNYTQVFYNDTGFWVRYTDEYRNYRCDLFDALGRLVSVIEEANNQCETGIVTNYYYDGIGDLLRTVNANQASTFYAYDNMGRLTTTTYADGTHESYIYDNNGNIVSKTDRKGVQTSYAYDSLNRVSTITYHGSTSTSDSYAYDRNSNLLQLQSQNATLSYSYDARNRVTCEKYAISGATSISGPCGTGGGGSVAAGTLITLANGTSIPVQRLSIGMSVLSYNVTTGQYAVSTITSLVTVDTDNMLVIRTQSPTPLRVDNATAQRLWVKTSSGTVGWLSVTQLRPGDSLFLPLPQKWTLVTSIEKASGGKHLMYDIYTTSPGDYIADGYLDPIKDGPSPPTPPGIVQSGYSLTYTYKGETLFQITYNDMDVVTYAYDGLGRVQNVTQSPASPLLLVKLSYYRNDQVSNMTYGSGVRASYTYDKLARPLNITCYGSRQLLSLAYSYNKTGTVANVIGQVNGTSVAEQYRYDPLLRLTNSTITNGGSTNTLWYQYDAMGNRIVQKYNALLSNYTYNTANNELLKSSTYNNGLHRWVTTGTYAYDRNGNLVLGNLNATGNSQWTYSWDVAGNLLRVANYTSVQGFYAYDGLGRRVEAKEGSSTTFYAFYGTETLTEKPTAGGAADYVYAGGLRIAKTGPSVITYYYVTDALGSTRLVTDTTGKAVFYDNYQPYGTDNTSKGIEAYKFTGKPVSQTTGLYYYGARWYDSTIGRFISQDPLAGRRADPQSLNPYVYVENAPTSSTDPTGMADCGWNPLSWRGCAENAGGVAWNGLTTAGTDIQNGWNSLSPEEQQGIILAGLVALTFATGGTDLLVVGAVGFAIGAGGYTGITVATGGTPTLQGALFWGTVGFGAATAIASLPSIGPRVMSTLGLRGAAEATAETGFSATRSGVGTFTKLGREIGVKHADAIDMAGGYQNYLNLIKDTVENGVDTSSIETTNPAYLTLRSTTSKFFVVADPNANSIVTAFYNTPRGPLGSLWQMLLKVPA